MFALHEKAICCCAAVDEIDLSTGYTRTRTGPMINR